MSIRPRDEPGPCRHRQVDTNPLFLHGLNRLDMCRFMMTMARVMVLLLVLG